MNLFLSGRHSTRSGGVDIARNAMDMIIGIGLIVLGVLLVVGELSLGFLVPYIGIILVVLGILMLLGRVAGGFLIGLVVLVLGVLMLVNFITFPEDIRDMMESAMGIINLVAGIVLVVLGAMRLMGK